MSIATKFSTFCGNLTISTSIRSDISTRYKAITKRLNKDFWETDSETLHSLYVGSYGRKTAINGCSDIDFIFVLPSYYYAIYNGYTSNGQSALLQRVRQSLSTTYPNTNIGADGQVVACSFSDDTFFEVVPAFENDDSSFTFPDTNGGGYWRITNPRPEIQAIADYDTEFNGNVKHLCKMTRAWKSNCAVPIGGLHIDTLAIAFLSTWKHNKKSNLYYDWMTRDFMEFLANQNPARSQWNAIGSNQLIYRQGNFEAKAKKAYNLALEAIEYEKNSYEWSANQKWREIYGSAFPNT
ncbi:MAG: nucleotidyltransferase [Ignavibacteria bacterium]|nr:nucleotidyltransferase [Ignavibacteria bacterium]